MTPKEYQLFVQSTAIFPDDAGIVYTTLGMIGEAGEVSEKVKKMIRRQQTTRSETLIMHMTREQKEDLIKEVGDVLWYATALLSEIGATLQDAIDKNVEKLSSRKERGVLEGNGDNR